MAEHHNAKNIVILNSTELNSKKFIVTFEKHCSDTVLDMHKFPLDARICITCNVNASARDMNAHIMFTSKIFVVVITHLLPSQRDTFCFVLCQWIHCDIRLCLSIDKQDISNGTVSTDCPRTSNKHQSFRWVLCWFHCLTDSRGQKIWPQTENRKNFWTLTQ